MLTEKEWKGKLSPESNERWYDYAIQRSFETGAQQGWYVGFVCGFATATVIAIGILMVIRHA